jgi:two-component system, NtrC family, response regulator AtoC
MTDATTIRDPKPASVTHGWVLLVTIDDDVRAFSLPERGTVTIGRAPTCDVAIDHEKISRQHARLTSGERWTVEDLGSRNGVTIRGVTIAERSIAEIVPGEPLALGPFPAVIVPRAVSAVRSQTGASRITIEDPTLAESAQLVTSIAKSPINVLITGETGAGKEVLARALHRLSGRSGPLLAINCAALSPQLLESELFGHEKGAFTGAVAAKPGLLESAAAGSVLLDEIGELQLDLQAKLLRAIETREVTRVGAVRAQPIDIRFVAATHRDLAAASNSGAFRRDLFYRLAGITLAVPPLRERRERVAMIACDLVRAAGRADDTLTPDARATLLAHTWPGNVRELRNVIDRALLLAGDGPIAPEHIMFDTAEPAPPPSMSTDLDGDAIAERDRIVAALDQCAGNQTHAAKKLGMSRASLVNKLAIYRVPRPRKR